MEINQLLNLSIRLAAPILLVALGGLFTLKVNIFNIALDGIMLMGCFGAVIAAHFLNSSGIGVLGGVLFSLVLTLIYAVLVLEFDVNPIICALAIIAVSSGLTRYLLIPIFGASGRFILPSRLALPTINLPILDNIPYIGPMLNNHSILVYLALLLPFAIHFLLYKTNLGLYTRAVGLNPEAAAADGIKVKRIQYLALIMTGILCGLGGAQLSLSLNMFNVGMSGGRGFIALAALILTGSQPILTFIACLVFGFLYALVLVFSGEGLPVQILNMLPYAIALLIAIIPALLKFIKKKVRFMELRKAHEA